MQPNVNLRLIREGLRQLAATPYFDSKVHTYSDNLCGAIDFALQNQKAIDSRALMRLSGMCWIAFQYLSGSISREAPYEAEYCLRIAARDWVKGELVFTTYLTDDVAGFHFYGINPWREITTLLPNFDALGYDPTLVLMGLPRLYRHKPVYCTPLYHELGHFVDRYYNITRLIELLGLKPGNPASGSGISGMHWSEYFADLFSACYIGDAGAKTLLTIAPDAPSSQTHPATSDRVDLVTKFLDGKADSRIDAIQMALRMQALPPFSTLYTRPDVRGSFDDLRTVVVGSDAELHGLFAASWDYLDGALSAMTLPASSSANVQEDEIEKIVNDLTEKSIRNYKVRKMWGSSASP